MTWKYLEIPKKCDTILLWNNFVKLIVKQKWGDFVEQKWADFVEQKWANFAKNGWIQLKSNQLIFDVYEEFRHFLWIKVKIAVIQDKKKNCQKLDQRCLQQLIIIYAISLD